MKGYVGEACPECGNFTMVRNGTCLECDTSRRDDGVQLRRVYVCSLKSVTFVLKRVVRRKVAVLSPHDRMESPRRILAELPRILELCMDCAFPVAFLSGLRVE
jgi:hypothetical protein